MKKIILIIIALSFVSTVFAGGITGAHKKVIARQTVAAGGAGADYTDNQYCHGAWLFGDDLNDNSGSNSAANGVNDLSAGGTPTYETARPNSLTTGKSLLLAVASSEYVYRATSGLSTGFPGHDASDDISYSIWLKLTANHAADGTLMGIGLNWRSRIDTPGDHLDMSIKDSANDEHYWFDIVDWTNDTDWHHICFQFDGSATQGQLWVSDSSFGSEINGTTETYTNVNNVKTTSSVPFNIGAYNSASNYFGGYVYQPIVFDATLDAIATDEGKANAAAVCEEMYDYGIDGGG